jgi:hypothetical protein
VTTFEASLPEESSQLHSNCTWRVGFAGGGAVRRPRSAPISSFYVPRGKMVSVDTSLARLPMDTASSWCGDPWSLESSTFSMVLQQMMEPIFS